MCTLSFQLTSIVYHTLQGDVDLVAIGTVATSRDNVVRVHGLRIEHYTLLLFSQPYQLLSVIHPVQWSACINWKPQISAYLFLYHGTFKPSNQIAQFAVNIFHTHLLGGEQVNRPIKISICAFPIALSHMVQVVFTPSFGRYGIHTILGFSVLGCVNPVPTSTWW